MTSIKVDFHMMKKNLQTGLGRLQKSITHLVQETPRVVNIKNIFPEFTFRFVFLIY